MHTGIAAALKDNRFEIHSLGILILEMRFRGLSVILRALRVNSLPLVARAISEASVCRDFRLHLATASERDV